MARRLSIVIVQSSNRPAKESAIEEELLIEVMTAPGLEPVVVRSLDQLQQHHTDLLALQSLTGDFVVCDWQSSDAVIGQLEKHGVETTRRASGDGTVSSRRVHVVDLRQHENPTSLIRRWQQMRQASDVAVVQIGIGTPAVRPAPASSGAAPAAEQQPTASPGSTTASPPDAELDALVDQLNTEHW